MSWAVYLGLILLLTLAFAFVYALAYSVVLGIRDNYLRYYQKAELQWTGPRQSLMRKVPLAWLIGFALISAWIVVEYVTSSCA